MPNSEKEPPIESDLLAHLMQGMDIGADTQINQFNNIMLMYVCNVMFGSMPDEMSLQVKKVLYEQWKDSIQPSAGSDALTNEMLKTMGLDPSMGAGSNGGISDKANAYALDFLQLNTNDGESESDTTQTKEDEVSDETDKD
jgi:hypothetical protein